MVLLAGFVVTQSALARPLDTADATTVGARTIQVEAGADLSAAGDVAPAVAVGVGLLDRLDVVAEVAPDDVVVGAKWLARSGSPQGERGPSLSLEAAGSPVAAEVGGAAAVSQQWSALSVHLAGDAAVGADGALGAGLGLGLEPLPSAPIRPATELRLDGGAVSALAAVVVTPGPAWMLDAGVVAAPDSPPFLRAGLTWAVSTRRAVEPVVADRQEEPPADAAEGRVALGARHP